MGVDPQNRRLVGVKYRGGRGGEVERARTAKLERAKLVVSLPPPCFSSSLRYSPRRPHKLSSMDLGRASYLPELSSSTNSEAATATHRTDQQILGPQEASRAAQSIWKHEHHQQSEQQQHLLSDTAARGIQESGGNAPWGWAE